MKYKVPKLSANEDEVIINSLPVKSGKEATKGDLIAVVETTKTSFEIYAEETGTIEYSVKEGDSVPVGDTLICQNETKISELAFQDSESKFTRKALKLIESEGLEQSLFSELEIVRESDVKKHLSNFKTEIKKEAAVSTLQDYIEPPVAYFSIKVPHEIEETAEEVVWKIIIQSDFKTLCKSDYLHNLVNFKGTILPYPLQSGDNDSIKKKTSYCALLRCTAERKYKRSENCSFFSKIQFQIPTCSSSLPWLNNHGRCIVELNRKEISVNFCYNHTVLNGKHFLDLLERIF